MKSANFQKFRDMFEKGKASPSWKKEKGQYADRPMSIPGSGSIVLEMIAKMEEEMRSVRDKGASLGNKLTNLQSDLKLAMGQLKTLKKEAESSVQDKVKFNELKGKMKEKIEEKKLLKKNGEEIKDKLSELTLIIEKLKFSPTALTDEEIQVIMEIYDEEEEQKEEIAEAEEEKKKSVEKEIERKEKHEKVLKESLQEVKKKEEEVDGEIGDLESEMESMYSLQHQRKVKLKKKEITKTKVKISHTEKNLEKNKLKLESLKKKKDKKEEKKDNVQIQKKSVEEKLNAAEEYFKTEFDPSPLSSKLENEVVDAIPEEVKKEDFEENIGNSLVLKRKNIMEEYEKTKTMVLELMQFNTKKYMEDCRIFVRKVKFSRLPRKWEGLKQECKDHVAKKKEVVGKMTEAEVKVDEVLSSFQGFTRRINNTKKNKKKIETVQEKVESSNKFNASEIEDDEVLETILETVNEVAPEKLEKFEGGKKKIGEGGARGLGGIVSNPFNKLEELDLSECGLNDATFRILGEAMLKGNVKLRTLNLYDNQISDDSFKLIADLVRINSTLEYLVLGKNPNVKGPGINMILHSIILNPETKVSSLRLREFDELDFSEPNIDHSEFSEDQVNQTLVVFDTYETSNLKNCETLAFLLSLCKGLCKFEFHTAGMNDEDMIHLFSMMGELPKLSSMSVTYCQNITLRSIKVLGEVQRTSESQEWQAEIWGCRSLGDEVFKYLHPDPKQTQYNFSSMNLTYKCLENVKNMVEKYLEEKKESISEQNITINLSSNEITNPNGELNFFYEWKPNIKTELFCNTVGNEGMEHTIETIRNNEKIESLDFYAFGMTEEISPQFWDAIFFKKKDLHYLRLGHNPIGSKGMKLMLDSLKRNILKKKDEGYAFPMKGVINFAGMHMNLEMVEQLVELGGWTSEGEARASHFSMKLDLASIDWTEETVLPFFQNMSRLENFNEVSFRYRCIPYHLLKVLVRELRCREGDLKVDLYHWRCDWEVDDEIVRLIAEDDEVLEMLNLPDKFEKELKRRLENAPKPEKKLRIEGNSLDLFKCDLTPQKMEEVVTDIMNDSEQMGLLETLSSINVGKNKELGDEGVNALNKLLVHCSELETFDVSRCGLSDQTLANLDLSKCTKIKVIRVAGNQVGEKWFESMKKFNL